MFVNWGVLLLLLECLSNYPTAGIINGVNTQIKHFPYLMQIRRKPSTFLCAGVLYARHAVLTVAHCVYRYSNELNPDDLLVVGGTQTTNGVPRYKEEVAAVRYHMNFASRFTTPQWDLAMIRLKHPFPPTHDIKNVPIHWVLPVSRVFCLIAGWGSKNATHPHVKQVKLNYGFLTSLNAVSCPYKIKDILCGVDKEKKYASCWGDDGGPFMCEGKFTGLIWACHRACDHTPETIVNAYSNRRWIEWIAHVNPIPPQGP
ncbi:serine protease 55-like [Hermetia illucens]|uniref:serine protease 55-like n=1 Tax=Hermetia illucens TaxID=343691 RepID=UPI0018CC461A|nr:serine protease 55-like [Hermetia illucens]XP_037912517.1 serine protease 55-like [Hermetia illucens]